MMPPKVRVDHHLLFEVGEASYVAFFDDDDLPCPADTPKEGLATVVPIPSSSTDIVHSITEYVQDALNIDDVFCLEFLSTIILHQHLYSEVPVDSLPPSWNTSKIFAVTDPEAVPLPGPYVVTDGNFRQVFRLYGDEVNAFSLATRHTKQNKLVPLRVGSTNHNTICVAVLSRLPFQPSPSKPLHGTRITVKDIFDVEGFKTSLGSKDYLRLYPPASASAPAIQVLIDAGCQVVGLSQMCSTVLKQDPTQSIEFLAPFNPRADGWQSPSGGSNGQGAAMAQYDWLDVAIASDCNYVQWKNASSSSGSVFSSSKHWCDINEGNVVWRAMDTPCFFGRDLSQFHDFAHAWYAKDLPSMLDQDQPRTLVVFKDYLPLNNPAQMRIFYDMVRDAERHLNVQVKELSIMEEWAKSAPTEACGAKLTDFIGAEVATRSYVYTFWQRLKPFWEDYQDTFGHKPYIPLPTHIETWKNAWHVTPAQHEAALGRIEVYKKWILNTVLGGQRNWIILTPLGNVSPSYRHEWPGLQGGDAMLWAPLILSPILGAPELIVPSGEIGFTSKISGREEFLPVCTSVMGYPGSDLDLIKMTLDLLTKSARQTRVKTGSRMF